MQGYRRRLAILLAAFFALELAIVSWDSLNRPYADEAHYVFAGRDILAGAPGRRRRAADLVPGQPVPLSALSALGFRAFGLAGLDAANALLSLAILALFAAATRRLFDDAASLWSTGLLAASGLFVSFAHLGVYDALACTGMMGALWGIVRWSDDPRSAWLVGAGLALSFGTLAKYPYGVTFVPLAGLLLALAAERRGRFALADSPALLGFAAAFGLPTLAYFLAAYGAPLPRTFGHYKVIDHGFAFILGLNGLYIAVPLIGGAFGVLRGPRTRAVRLALYWPLFLWPAIHVAVGAFYSSDKHAVIGMLFAYPLVGVVLARFWGEGRRALVAIALVGVLVHGAIAFGIRALANIDLRAPLRHVSALAEPGDRVLSFCCFMAGRLIAASEGRDDLDVFEAARRRWERDVICQNDWLVAVEERDPLAAGNRRTHASGRLRMSGTRAVLLEVDRVRRSLRAGRSLR